MDDERQGNLLLAIVLSLVVMLAWGWFERTYIREDEVPAEETAAPTEPAEMPTLADDTVATPAPAPLPAPDRVSESPSESPSEVPVPAPVAVAREAVLTRIETPLLHIELSSHGALPVVVALPAFATKTGENGPVQLVWAEEGPPPADAAGAAADAKSAVTALDIQLPDGRRLQDADFDVTLYKPGETAHDTILAALDAALAQPARGTDPVRLREAVEEVLRARGVNPAVAWTVAAAATDVPLSNDGWLEPGWSTAARANQERLRSAYIVDYRLPLGDGAVLHKLYVIDTARYGFDLTVALENPSGGPAQFGDAEGYALLWGPGVPSSERSPRQDPLQGMWVFRGSLKRKAPGVGIRTRIQAWLSGGPKPTPQPIVAPPDTDWFGLRRKYFMVGVHPMHEGALGRFLPVGNPGERRIELQVQSPPLRADAGALAAHRYVVAAAPLHRAELVAVGHDFDLAISFGWFNLFGRAMLTGLLLFNGLVRNYGIAIILLTILVRLGLFPLNQRSYQSMRAMSVMQPKITEIRERYKNDPQEMNKRTWELYREHNINPLGGCLPMAMQMPVFLALFNALRGAIELRGADFLWISDLSEPDRLAVLPGGFSLNILPLLMIGAMLAQQRMSTPPPSASNDPNAEMQRKMMQWMPLMFGVMFYGMPSGLTLYWLVSTLLGIGQQYYVNKPAPLPEHATQSPR